jgi:hypothetical protein
MTPKRTSFLRRAIASIGLLLALAEAAQRPVLGAGPIVWEDFSTVRMNGDTPASPLWDAYTGSSSDGPGQTGRITNKTFELTVPGGQAPYFHFSPYPYDRPSGFAKGNLRSGSWDPTVNRLTFWLKTTANVPRRSDGGATVQIGTYTKRADNQPSNQGEHYYHYLNANHVPGRWVLVTLNRVPQHQVGMNDPNPSYPENPTSSRGWDYFDGLTRWYFADQYLFSYNWSGVWTFADFQFSKVVGEPDTLVSTVAATYTGDHYEVSWQGPRNVVQGYSVYAAPSSMKTWGLQAGTRIGTAQTRGDTYTAVFVASSPMAQPGGGTYLAIQPNGQSAFTEVYLATGPGQGSGSTSYVPPRAPESLRLTR